MKNAKKALAFMLCILMNASVMFNEGWVSLLQSNKASAIAGHEQNYNDARVELDFNKGWKFAFSEDSASYLKGFDDSGWENVDLPHDFSMEQGFSATGTEAESGNIPGGTGWYRKWFNLYEYYTGNCITIDFDGAYQHAYVYVNGQYVGENHYGYNSFSFEISDYLICSNTSLNLIAVKVVNEIPSSRWYSGSGINRDVRLTIKGPVHVSLYGPQVTTPGIANGDGTVNADITMHNDTAISKKVIVEATILDDNHNAVSDTVVSSTVLVPANAEQTVTLKPEVDSPKLWSPDSPNLYKLRTVIRNEDGDLIDEYHTTFGYRYIEWDEDTGFSINGKLTKLKGVSLHHDQGALGAVQEYDAIYRQLSILKDMGCNAIRTTHNTASRVVIDICNELGLFVMEEFFDGWDASKNYNDHDFSEYFNQTVNADTCLIGAKGQKWFEFVVEQTVLRDRHDPCIIAWGVGNELYNITVESPESTVNYENIVKSIADITDRLDPDIVLTQGNNKSHADATMLVDRYMDVIGGNYNPYAWSLLMGGNDDFRSSKPFVATEAASANNSRGVYYTMGADDATLQCTSYDTYAVSWGNEAAEAWYYVATNDFFSGEFVWTGFDYIGETTPWMNYSGPNENFVPNTSYFGIVDTAGFAKDSYYLYRSLWNEESTTLHLVPGSWNSENLYVENGYVNVAVYSNAKKIELLLNGNVIATATSAVNTTPAGYTYKTWTESIVDYSNCKVGSFYTGSGEDFYPQFNVKYAAGELSVKAYDENGAEITDTVGLTKSVSGTATQIAVKTWQDKNTYVADGSDYIYVEFEAQDANGNFMNDYNGTINFDVDDDSDRYAKIIGVDNGNSATAEKFQQDSVIASDAEAEIQMFNGRALVILKTTEEEGTINFTAVANDGTSEIIVPGVTVTSVSETGIELTDEFEEVVFQNGKEYEVTLYDEYEMVKHHINELEPPKAEEGDSGSGGTGSGDDSGSSGDSGSDSSKILENFEIYQVDSTAVDQYIPDGEYVIFNQNYEYIEEQDVTVAHDAVFSTDLHWGYALLGDTIQSAVDAAAGSAYSYEKIYTSEENIFKFIHQGNNKYYIQSKSTGQYLKIGPDSDKFVFDSAPQEITVTVDSNGSIMFSHGDWGIIHYFGPDHFYAFNIAENWVPNYASNVSCKMWLYTPKYKEVETETRTPDKYVIYEVDSTVSEGSIPDGEYIINNGTYVMSDDIFDGWTIAADNSLTDCVWASEFDYTYKSFNTSADNILIFTHQGGNRYYIQNKKTGEYIVRSNWAMLYSSTPESFRVEVNDNGSIEIISDSASPDLNFARRWEYFEQLNVSSENTAMWLYIPQYPTSDDGDDNGGNEGGGTVTPTPTPTINPYKKVLYDILHEGIGYDYSAYTRTSYEKLLDALDAGVTVYKKDNVTDAELSAATEAIRAAIDALSMDIKKINGTLFKYGYNNSTGAADYSDGGLLMNDIAVRQMKTAILADQNLVRQIKDIIGYDTNVWGAGQADTILDEAAEIYARIYTLMFTGKAQNDINIQNSPTNFEPISLYSKIPLTLWNVWTKDNTHGANDPHEKDGQGNELAPIHDGASVQGLASATLDKGVITSHAAYTQGLPYANDGPVDMYDIDKYSYGFDTGAGIWKQVTLEPLSGISVHFPDLFTRESLDASGNVTDATSGQYAKYYWDTEFPMFISTDEYGVNTYHYDSKDTRYLVQASFDDENHTAEMELNEVGKWTISGPNNETKSGFFPFNYKEGTTDYNSEDAVYHYGFTFEHNFYIPKGGKHVNGEDVIFNFSGDDDVYVYIDGVLVLDNGGLHGARAATINFTDCSINYQYAMDVTDGVLKGDEFETTYSYNKYIENPDATGYNADTIAAINKLHEVITDGEVHTLNFFYLERGASDSNCLISFNLSETSEEVKITDQNLTLDYGLPVEYDITSNNEISQAALDNGVEIEYLGICAVNEDYTPTYTFELPQIIIPFEDGKTYTVDGMKYGTCTVDNKGNVSYSLESTNMKESENFFVVAKITGDPTYAEEVVYYQIEKTTFIPATAIYYEDTFDTITYTNGKVPANYDNNTNQYGIWKTEGMQSTDLKQAADITDSEANPYGYETNYLSFAEYSGNSTHYVDVSTKNNPNKKYSGGTGAAWPTVEFDFTGTGFDLISVTDSTTGAFSVMIKDENGASVLNTVVDTFYGYNYGRIYSDANGKPSLDSTLTPMYKSENGLCTSDARFYDENGAITSTAHYYGADGEVTETVHYYDENGMSTDVPHYYENGKVVETETDNPSYAYSYAFAYGWVVATDDSKDTLYQIPVIKITDLEYGHYDVVITPTFTSAFRHSSTAEDGTSYYRVYLDAIKIYSPAGENDDIKDRDVKKAYATDDEQYPSYLELKDMLIGADSLAEEKDTQGIIFIDGIAALNNDIATYKNAGPNNELYLAKDQAVAFEIWATSVPTDIQLGTKLACGNPKLTVSYASKTTDTVIETATDIYYSLNTMLPNDAKLTWKQVEGSDGNNYYTTGTVVIQNTGDEDSVLSLTNLKWTFSQNGGKGYFRIPTPIDNEVLMVASTNDTPIRAYSLMSMRTAALGLEMIQAPRVIRDKNGDGFVVVNLKSSLDVDSFVVTERKGIRSIPKEVESVASHIDGNDYIEWVLLIPADEIGTFTYEVTGAYANGYVDESKTVTFTITVTPLSDDEADDGTNNKKPEPAPIIDLVTEWFAKFFEFIRSVFASIGIIF
ncbi:MAG: DUF4982 domain-containing protein [Clostridia bacterium]|nr:DUF4982 domain-containing protein [Clostridia bacterium]